MGKKIQFSFTKLYPLSFPTDFLKQHKYQRIFDVQKFKGSVSGSISYWVETKDDYLYYNHQTRETLSLNKEKMIQWYTFKQINMDDYYKKDDPGEKQKR